MKNKAVKMPFGALKMTDELMSELERQQVRFGIGSLAEAARVALACGVKVLKGLPLENTIEKTQSSADAL